MANQRNVEFTSDCSMLSGWLQQRWKDPAIACARDALVERPA